MRDLQAIARWLAYEGRAVGGFAREPELWAALLCGLLLWTLAYQAPYAYQIDVGGSRQTGRQWDDAPFLVSFNDPEPPDLSENTTTVPYRWAREASAIRLPGIGGGRWQVAIKAASGRRGGEPVPTVWDDGTTSAAISVGGQPRAYQLVAAADDGGDLALDLAAAPLDAPGDPRSLGVVIFQVSVGSGPGMRLPSLRQLGLLAAALALAYALLRRLALLPSPALAAALALAALAAALLTRERMALTLLAPRLPAILGGAYALSILLDTVYRRLVALPARVDLPRASPAAGARGPAARVAGSNAIVSPIGAWPALPRIGPPYLIRQPSLVVGLVALALVLRLGGMLHPHARFSDDGLNANNLIGFTGGEVYFTEGLPSEAGGGQVPYPPGQYIILAPARLLISNDRAATKALEYVGNALWDSLVVGLLWYMLRRGGYGPRASLLGAACYIAAPPMLKSLSIGEFANVFGQGLALPLLAFLAIRARRLYEPGATAALAVLLALALLGHLGVTISLFCVLGYLGLAWLIRLETRRSVQALIYTGLLVVALLALLYYTSFWDILGARAGAGPAPEAAGTVSAAQIVLGQASTLPVFGLTPLAIALGAAGALLVALRPRRIWTRAQPALGSLLIAWWGGTLLSFGLLLVARQGVRWQQFLYPALCLGAGPALAALWSRGRAGRLVAGAALGFLIWYGLAYWVGQISDYLH